MIAPRMMRVSAMMLLIVLVTLSSFATLTLAASSTTSGTVLYCFKNATLNRYQIASVNLATGVQTAITTPPVGKNDMNPSVSPDGRTAVFYSDRSGNQQIWSVDLVTLAVSWISQNTAGLSTSSCFDPKFSPDGTRVLFKSNYNDGLGDIWLMNRDGTGGVNLTPGRTTTEDWAPCFSGGTGSKVFFTSRSVPDQPTSDEIVVMNIDGTSQIQLTNNNVPDWYPSAHPTRDLVVFVSKSATAPTGSDVLLSMTSSGGSRSAFYSGSDDLGDPAWASDGRTMAFVQFGGGNGGTQGYYYEAWVVSQEAIAGSAIRAGGMHPGSQLGPSWGLVGTTNTSSSSSSTAVRQLSSSSSSSSAAAEGHGSSTGLGAASTTQASMPMILLIAVLGAMWTML